MTALTVGDVVYDAGRDEMATVIEIGDAPMIRLEPVDGGPSWTAASHDLTLQRSAA